MEVEKKKKTKKPTVLPLQEKETREEPVVTETMKPNKDVTIEVFENPIASFNKASQEFIKKHNIYNVNKK